MGTDAVTQFGAAHQRPAFFEAEQQGPAKSVAATGRVYHFRGHHRRDQRLVAVHPDLATVRAQRDHQALHPLRYLRAGQACPVTQQFGFVVINRDPGRQLDKMRQVLAVKHGQTLTWIEHKRNAGGLELLGMLQHGVAPVRRDDADADIGARRNFCRVRLAHRPRMEGGDLVVVAVRHDHGLGGVGVAHLPDKLGADAQGVQTRHILGAIGTHSRHGQGRSAQLLQAVGNVAGATAKLPAQGRHEKRHIEDVQLVGQDLLGKAPLKRHDGVKGQGTTNYSRHGDLDSVRDKKQGPGSRQSARARKAARATVGTRWRRVGNSKL